MKQWKLRYKIIFHIAVIGVLTALFLVFLFINTQRGIIHKMSQQKAELIGSMIEKSISSYMTAGNMETVLNTLRKISSAADIKKIRVIDYEGKISHSSESEEVGNSVEQDTHEKIKEFLREKNQSSTTAGASQSTILGLRKIENNSECFSCHSPQENISSILEVDIDQSMAVALLQKNQMKGIAIALCALVVLSFVILRLFEKLINRPISQLKEKMKKVQEGDLDIQFSPLKNDEIGGLAKNFNSMISDLKKANQKIEELFSKQMEKAEHLASIGELAAGLAHEIKNPIAGMKGALEIINQKTNSSDPKKEIFTEILLQIDKINNVVHDLLRYARPKELSMSTVNPNESISTAIKFAKTQINDKEIDIRFNALTNGTEALIDADKIQEVMLNLMINSISAINKKGLITINLSEKGKRVLEIILSDDGMGIKKDHLPQIFHPFFTTKNRGTGLGLSICKKIIEAHKGTIEVESRENEGTTFTIELPVLLYPE
jgi:signal transduction histidine kinase